MFFTAIAAEVSFSRSQLAGLRTASRRLKQEGFMTEFIALDAPERDALNLLAFDSFYKSLNKEEQTILLQELLLVVVLQAGSIYAKKAGSAYDLVAFGSRYESGFCLFPPPTALRVSTEKKESEFKLQ